MIKYTVTVHKAEAQDDYYPLTTRTDKSARGEARKIIKRYGLTGWITLDWFRTDDQCKGTIDI